MKSNHSLSLPDVDETVWSQISQSCGIAVDEIEDVYNCTPFQTGLMADSATYTQRFVHSLNPSVDVERFCSALNQVIAASETLRTRIVDCDLGLVQVVVRKEESDSIHRASTQSVEQYLEHDRSIPMELGSPLARFAIIGEKKLLSTVHHAISDHYSLKYLFADTWSIYQQQVPAQHAPFKKFVNYCNAIEEKKAITFWKNQFKGGIPTVFPVIPPGHVVRASQKTARKILLKKAPSPALMPAYIEAAWSLTVADYTSSECITFGYVMSGRTSALGGVETTLGPTITTVPIQVQIKPTITVQQLLKSRNQSRRLLSTSPALQFGMAKIRNNINDEARVASSFQTVVNILHEAETEADTPGLTLDEEMDIHRAYGLVLTCTIGESSVLIKVAFDDTVLPETQMQRVLRQMEHRLKGLVDAPPSTQLGALQRLNFGDTLDIMNWNKNDTEPTERCLHELISMQVVQDPEAIAVDAWDGQASYQQLERMTNNLAFDLLRLGVSKEEPVLFMLERSLLMVVAVLGIMKAGGTCVPVDVSHPKARKETIASLSGAKLVVTSPGNEQDIANCTAHVITLAPDAAPEVPELIDSDPTRAAYIMFTSGSTGQPKGVVLEHRSLASSFSAFGDRVGWKRGTRVLQFAAPVWDACALEILGPLIKGGCVCIPSSEQRESGLADYIQATKVEFAIQTPTALRNLSPAGVLPTLKGLMSAGEPIPRDAAHSWGSELRLFNGWGPCETSVCASIAELSPASTYPHAIGRPVGTAMWIVDRTDCSKLVPIGAIGEILVQGPGVARGYHNEPTKTAASFVPAPPFVPKCDGHQQTLFRTGDLARYNPDGSIAFIGRQDNQVKVRGQRFELGEVEQLLMSHRNVRAVAATIHQSSTGDGKNLVAILTLSGDSGYSSPTQRDVQAPMREVLLDEDNQKRLDVIRDFAQNSLPTYMVPTAWIVVSSLPQLASTKIDRTKIKGWLDDHGLGVARHVSWAASASILTPPTGTIEKVLQQSWASVLGVELDKIGRESSFMKLGGDSITAMQVATRCRKQGLKIHVAILLRKDSLAETACATEVLDHLSLMPSMSAADEAVYRPLSPIQKFLADNNGPASNNWFNQAFLLEVNMAAGEKLFPVKLQHAVDRIVTHHSMLRARFTPSKDSQGNSTLLQRVLPIDTIETWRFTVHRDVSNEENIQQVVNTTQSSLDIFEGPVFAVDLIFTSEGKTLLFMAAHHLVVDLVTWRILWEDLEAMLSDRSYSLSPSLPFPLWCQTQAETLVKQIHSVSKYHQTEWPKADVSKYHQTEWPKADLAFWHMEKRVPIMADVRCITRKLNMEETAKIMGEECNAPLKTTPAVLMLTAVLLSFARIFPDRGSPAAYSEGHGRDFDSSSKFDPSRTVGWFTTMMPIAGANINKLTSLADAAIAVKDCYHAASANATENFTREVLQQGSLQRSDVEMLFNFTGRLQQVTKNDALFKLWKHESVQIRNSATDAERVGLLSVLAYIDEDECLTLMLEYDYHMAHQERISQWMQEAENTLSTLATDLPKMSTCLTMSDLPLLDSNATSLQHVYSCLKDLNVPQDNVESIYPCTAMQEGILFSQLKEDWSGDGYRDRFAFRLTSQDGTKVDLGRVAVAWKQVCQSHPILRTVFASGLSQDGAFQQIVLKHIEPEISIDQGPTDNFDVSEILQGKKKTAPVPNKPPHHLSLFEAPGGISYAIMEISHAALDARTMQAFWAQIGRAYSHPNSLPKGRHFSDYVVWLKNQEDTVRQYWKTYLAGAQPSLFPRDSEAVEATYRTKGPQIPFHRARELNTFCQGQGITVANFMQASWGVVLGLFTGLPDVHFGCLRSDQDALEGAADILGPLATMLVCKFQLGDSTSASDLLRAAREDASRALQNSGCSLAKLHDDLGLSGSPLFDTIMTIQHAWPTNLGLGGEDLIVQAVDGEDPTEYTISVSVHYSKDELALRLSYQPARISDTTVEHIVDIFGKVISFMMDFPDQGLLKPLGDVLAMQRVPQPVNVSASSADLAIFADWNTKFPTSVQACIPERVRETASRRPLAPAVTSWDCSLEYGQLDVLSDCLAYRLREDHGVKLGDIVPFACEKAASALVILLAISKAGAAFLPLDITHSTDRLTTVLEDAGASLVLVNSSALHNQMSACKTPKVLGIDLEDLITWSFNQDARKIREELESIPIQPSSAAYAVYTSGSTGKPKGILVDHSNIATSAVEHATRLGINAQTRMLQLSSFTFDVGLGDIVYALFTGACLCMPSESERSNDIAGAIRRMKANFLWATPTHATLLTPEEVPTLQTMALIGEPMRQENVERWASHLRLINSYGPAEATVMASSRDVVLGGNPQDIGYPSCGRFWVVDPDNSDVLLPPGAIGELVIEGPLVARGYINNTQATAAAFITAPAWTETPELAPLNLASQRFYKTGDLVRQTAADAFIYEGRKDTQVKLRGLRIELGEIEYHLNHATKQGWHWVVEVSQTASSEDLCLAAFYETSVSEDSSGSNDQELLEPLMEDASIARDALQRAVPSYMVPAYLIRLRKLPTTSSMKTDRKLLRSILSGLTSKELLPYRATTGGSLEEGLVERRKEVNNDELFMQQAWADVLNMPKETLTASDDFFSVGGNSIRAMHLVAKVKKMGYSLSVADVFKSPRLADMVCAASTVSDVLPVSAEAPPRAVEMIDMLPNLPKLAEQWTWLRSENFMSVARATDTQAWMLAVGESAGHGFDDVVTLRPCSGQSLDLVTLRRACEEVIRRHHVLRTIFMQSDSQLFQIILEKPPVEQIWPYIGQSQQVSKHDRLKTLPSFHLSSVDGTSCDALELRIHHALYDAMSLSHILEDLSAAYAGLVIKPRPTPFHQWISHVSDEETRNATQFWGQLLAGSKSLSLSASPATFTSSTPAYSKIAVSVPLANLQTSLGTSATVVKAAWSLVLSRVLDHQDIVFGYISANRYSNKLPEVERIAGPCINILPVRAKLDTSMTLESYVSEQQQQSNESIPYHHLGFRSIVKKCTQWSTSRFNSIIVYQNHESLNQLVKLGDVDCTFSGDGQVGDSADIWLTAMPQANGRLDIVLHYSSQIIPPEQAQAISKHLEALLIAMPEAWSRTLDQLVQVIPTSIRAAQMDDKMDDTLVNEVESERQVTDLVDEMLRAKTYEY